MSELGRGGGDAATRTGRRRFLVGVDFGEPSRAALAFASELAPPLGAEVVLLHVIHGIALPYTELPPALVERELRRLEAAAGTALAELAARAGGARTVLRHGDPASAVLEVADALGATLIVLGTHGRHGVPRLVLGSVAEHVIRESPVPVVTVRAPGAAE